MTLLELFDRYLLEKKKEAQGERDDWLRELDAAFERAKTISSVPKRVMQYRKLADRYSECWQAYAKHQAEQGSTRREILSFTVWDDRARGQHCPDTDPGVGYRRQAGGVIGAVQTYGPGFRLARAAALARSLGRCQFCGQRAATDGHHWPEEYPADEHLSSDHLTALCAPCHRVATEMRRFVRAGGCIFAFLAALTTAIKETYK